MAIKVVNNTTGYDSLILTLLLFGAYPHMYSIDPPIPKIIQEVTTIEKAIEQARKIRAKNHVIDVLNKKNRPLVNFIHDLPLNSNVLVWQEDNIRQTSKWTGLFKLLSIEGEIYKIYLASSSTDF